MINYESLTGLSQIVSKLSIFLFIIASNYVGDIYSCGIRTLLKKYMIIKHIFGFFIMLFFVGLVQEKLKINERIFQSVLLYLWFIFIMRSPTFITFITIIIIALIYLIDLYVLDIKNKLDENEEINEENNKLIEKYTTVNNVLFVISFFLSVIGTCFYIYFLKTNLGNEFNIIKFIFGITDEECFNKYNIMLQENNNLFFNWNKKGKIFYKKRNNKQ